MAKDTKVTHFGQVWTPQAIVEQMLGLIKNDGTQNFHILEPSCGAGAFFKPLFTKYGQQLQGIELDQTLKSSYNTEEQQCLLFDDFFNYSTDHKFNTIIGNPPYVAYKMMLEQTKNLLHQFCVTYPCFQFNQRTNLYLFFIAKCCLHLVDGGELIFIVPRDFLYATAANDLHKWMFANGTITDLIDFHDTKLFANANLDVVIFRWQKGLKTHFIANCRTAYKVNENGNIFFTNDKQSQTYSMNTLFDVHVGAVSGNDQYFTNPNGNTSFVYSKTAQTGKTRQMLYDPNTWIRDQFHDDTKQRIYVNCRTRLKNPFFLHPCKNYDGSVLALFLKHHVSQEVLIKIVDCLNNYDWTALHLSNGAKFTFTQRALSNAPLPKALEQYL